MQRVEHANGVATYTFDQLAGLPVVAHITARHGGVSPAPWQSLNFSESRGDSRENVTANRELLAQALGYPVNERVFCAQVHGTGIAKVDWQDAGKRQDGCDGLVTDAQRLPLSLIFGDCVPLLLYDRVQHVLGFVHAGWRSTVNGAGTALLWSMIAGYNTNAADVLACIGPSIGPDSFEVGHEVVDMVRAKLPDAEHLLSWRNGTQSNPYFDLWEANALQLEALGVPRAQIEIAGIDTAQRTDEFFSHRAEQGKCGLFAMVGWLGELPVMGDQSS